MVDDLALRHVPTTHGPARELERLRVDHTLKHNNAKQSGHKCVLYFHAIESIVGEVVDDLVFLMACSKYNGPGIRTVIDMTSIDRSK